MTQTITLVPFEARHIDQAVRLSRQAGWPHRAEDWAFTLQFSTGVVALSGDTVVGTALCSAFGDQTRINMIIVEETARGQGLGRRLMDAVIALAAGRCMALVATADGLPLYRKLGFVPTGQVLQHQGIVANVVTPSAAVRRAGPDDLAALCAMDRVATGADRSAMIAGLMRIGTIYRTDTGYAALRDFGRGQAIGPVVAADRDTAQALIAAAATSAGFLRVDTTSDMGIAPFLHDLGLAHVGGGTLMVCGTPQPTGDDFKTYALTSQALG
ncbi:MAG TPA: GNAT family N-acetyltransferase [Paenirhodobacter sp.]